MIHQPYVSRFDYLVITDAQLRISLLFWFIYKTPQYPQSGGLRTDFSILSVFLIQFSIYTSRRIHHVF